MIKNGSFNNKKKKKKRAKKRGRPRRTKLPQERIVKTPKTCGERMTHCGTVTAFMVNLLMKLRRDRMRMMKMSLAWMKGR